MAIQMTKAEYQNKYGSAPVINTSDGFDIAPAPVRMSREDYNKQYGIEEFKPTGTIRDAFSDVADIGRASKDILLKTRAKGKELAEKQKAGEITSFSRHIGTIGAGFKGGVDIAGEIVLGALKVPLHPLTEREIGNYIGEKGAQAVDFASKEYRTTMKEWESSDSREKQDGAVILRGLEERYKTDANFRVKVDGFGGIAEGLAELTGARGAGKIIKGSVEAGTDFTKPTIKQAFDVARNRIAPTLSRDADVVIKTRAGTLAKLEDKYVNMRNLNKFTPDGGESSRLRIASTDVLNDVVDSDGVIRTTGKGGAIERYKAVYLNDVEDVVRQNLALEAKTINLQEIRNSLLLGINESGLIGADLSRAIKGIEKEIAGLRIWADELDEVQISRIHDAKIGETKQINFQTPAEKATYRKAKARVYKEIVEDKSDFDVKGLNAELKQYYDDIKRLELLDGKRVKGGRLGRYFSQISGNIIGGATGHAVGGPAGMAVGSIVGGELADLLQRSGMKQTFKGKSKPAPKSQKLIDAKTKAGGDPVVDLTKPDRVIGVPSSVTKTPEMRKLQRQMTDNVKQQKQAIKANDYTQVASLKEIYTVIADKLRILVRKVGGFIDERGNSQGGFITNPFVRDEIAKVKPSNPRNRNIFNEAKEALKNKEGNAGARELLRDYVDGRKTEATRTELATAIDILNQKAKAVGKPDTKQPQSKVKNPSDNDTPKSGGVLEGEKDPVLKTKREVSTKDMAGNKFTIPADTVIEPHIKGGKVSFNLDGEVKIIPKNQYQNLVGQSDVSKATPFAPELDGTVESVRGNIKQLSGEEQKRLNELADIFELKRTPSEQKEYKTLLKRDNTAVDTGVATKYSQYTLDGAENYREIIVQAPENKAKSGYGSFTQKMKDKYGDDWNAKMKSDEREKALSLFNAKDAGELKSINYKSSHWTEPNPLFHLRMNDRTFKGKKTTFMEELQSDWAKDGREKGFATAKESDYTIKKVDKEDHIWEVFDKDGKSVTKIGGVSFNTDKEVLGQFIEQANKEGVPNHPLLKNWQVPAVKRALLEADKDGSKIFSWINGAQTSQRYKLSTQLKKVKWEDAGDGLTEIDLFKQDGSTNFVIKFDKDGVVKDSHKDWEGKKLDEVLGKGMADSIMKKKSGTLEGEGLNFGGEWAVNLYDKQVRDIVKKLTGAEIKTADMGLGLVKTDEKLFTFGGNHRDVGGFADPSRTKINDVITDEAGRSYIVMREPTANGTINVIGESQFNAIKPRFIGEDDLAWQIHVDGKETDFGKGVFPDKKSAMESAEKIAKRARQDSLETKRMSTGASNAPTEQQYIELTPDVIAKIKGEAPKFKMPEIATYGIPLILAGTAVSQE